MKHIAIIKEPYFSMVLRGEKTIESRWSMHKVAPYQKVQVGDEILIKKTGQPVTVKAEVADVQYFTLTPQKVDEIRIMYGKQIGTDKLEDWQSTLQKKYCTLVWLKNVVRIPPLVVPRSNGAGWIVCK